MEEMVYSLKRCEYKILARGWYKGYEYLCISYGTHPCAYVVVAEGQSYYGIKDCDDAEDLPCHGGCTYVSRGYADIVSEDFTVLGWDYAHIGDFVGYYITLTSHSNSKKWTTKELIKDCKHVIEYLYFLEHPELFYK